jgi:acylphosphatase
MIINDLNDIRNDLSGDYELGNNVDLTNVNWIPIGDEDNPFTGRFNGGNYIITGLKDALFHTITNARIENINIEKGSINKETNEHRLAFIVKYAVDDNILKNIHVYGDIHGGQSGGIVGYAENVGLKMCRCSFKGYINGNGSSAGLVGIIHTNNDNGSVIIVNCAVDVRNTNFDNYFAGLCNIHGKKTLDVRILISNCIVTGFIDNVTFNEALEKSALTVNVSSLQSGIAKRFTFLHNVIVSVRTAYGQFLIKKQLDEEVIVKNCMIDNSIVGFNAGIYGYGDELISLNRDDIRDILILRGKDLFIQGGDIYDKL